MRKGISSAVALIAATTFAAPASAVGLTSDLATWQALAGSFIEDTEYGTTGDTITTLTLDDGTILNFDVSLGVAAIGDGWGTWCCGYTGDVLTNFDFTSVTVDFGTEVNDFGFYAEPNNFGTFLMTLTLDDGSTLNQLVEGDSGALFFGWNGAGVDSFTISAVDDAAGFAFGDFFVSAGMGVVPEPGTWAMMVAGFGAVGYALRRRKDVRIPQAV